MSADTSPPDLPLRALWRLELMARGRAPHRPLLHAGRVATRCNHEVVAADAATGARLWNTRVEPTQLAGQLLMACGELILTDQRQPATGTTVLVALDWSGRQVWTRELGVLAPQTAFAWDERGLFLVGVDPDAQQQFLLELDARTGAIRAKHPLAWSAHALALHGERLLAANRQAQAPEPGLFHLTRGGGNLTPVSPLPVERVLVTPRSVLTLGASSQEEAPPPLVEAREPGSLAVRWSAPASEAVLGADGGQVVHLEGTEEQRRLVLRDEHTGAVRWRAPATQSMAVEVSFSERLVVLMDLDGLGVYRREDGELLGYEEGSQSGVTPGEERLYFGHGNILWCLSAAE